MPAWTSQIGLIGQALVGSIGALAFVVAWRSTRVALAHTWADHNEDLRHRTDDNIGDCVQSQPDDHQLNHAFHELA